jgi:hypothetical protein
MAIVVSGSGFRLTKGEPRQVEHVGDSGRTKVLCMCPDCGSWIFSMSKPDNGVRRVRVGSLDDKSWITPTAHYWTRSKQPWLTLPAGDEIFETQPE